MAKVTSWTDSSVPWGCPFSFTLQVKDRATNGNTCAASAELAAQLQGQLSLEVEGSCAGVVMAKLRSISVQGEELRCTGALELAGGQARVVHRQQQALSMWCGRVPCMGTSVCGQAYRLCGVW